MTMKPENSTKQSLPDFINPFDGRDPEEVWKELKAKAKPITKEELIKRIEELRNKKS